MNIIMLGPPGAGKGTQSDLISKDFNLKKISSGNILRNSNNLDNKNKILQNSGILIPDNVIMSIIIKEINKYTNFLLDGYPRTLKQAINLKEQNIKIKYVINIKLTDVIITNRLKYRLIHKKSGRTYNEIYNPSIKKNIDDITGDKLVKRLDDNKNCIKIRLNEYRKNINDLINWYNCIKQIKIININGNNTVNNIFLTIKNRMKQT